MTIFDQAKAGMMDVKLPPPGQPPLKARIVADVLEGLNVLNTMHGLAIPADVLVERARNICAGLIGNYDIKDHNDKGDQRT